ncbi:MAG: FixH family protein [Saprospiraceae bacterium]|nr:FixH family protein [Saprospiraceae bacterium]
MKFNFGTGIFVFLVIFICTLIFVVLKSATIDHSLVADDYYNEDIHYQEKYDKISRSNGAEMVRIDQSGDQLVIQFSDNTTPNGVISFYRPSDKSLDFSKNIALDDKLQMVFAKNEIAKGKWRIKVDWTEKEKTYYKEFEFFN